MHLDVPAASLKSQIEAAIEACELELAKRDAPTILASIPEAMRPLLAPARYKGAFGGRGGMKSQTFARMLLIRAKKVPGTRAVCMREFQKSLEQSVKRLLDDLITEFNLGPHGFEVFDTRIDTPGDGVVIFQGMQDHTAESIKSLEGYSIAWVEEAQTLSQRSLDLLRPTIREEDSELWFSWNPRRPTDPVDALLRGEHRPDSAIVLPISYKDNPYFPEVLRREMEYDQARDPEKYAHIWLGEYERISEARVFKNYTVKEFETPSNAAFLFGADWGFAIDPTVAVRGFIDGRTLYIDHEVYRVGCDIDDTPALFDGLACTRLHTHDIDLDRHHRDWTRPSCLAHARGWELIADSARPETISYMQRHGYPRIKGARKGPGSVEEGIEFLKSYDIIVHPRCTHVIDELTMYSFKMHPLTRQVIPVLMDAKNHTIDSLRYMAESLRIEVSDGSLVW